jgi:histone deacetylase 1/2
MIQPDMELSDSEDEGEGGRRNHQDHKSGGKEIVSGKAPEIDISASTLLSSNSLSRSPHATKASISSETAPSSGANESEKNDSGAPMEVDTTPKPPN